VPFISPEEANARPRYFRSEKRARRQQRMHTLRRLPARERNVEDVARRNSVDGGRDEPVGSRLVHLLEARNADEIAHRPYRAPFIDAHNLKPPVNARALLPKRMPAGSRPSNFALPPPRTT